MPRMEVVAAVAFAIALAYLWMRWDEHRDLRKKKVEQRLTRAAGYRKDR
jgi:membrane protein implicated in regulation of membrane protease activity